MKTWLFLSLLTLTACVSWTFGDVSLNMVNATLSMTVSSNATSDICFEAPTFEYNTNTYETSDPLTVCVNNTFIWVGSSLTVPEVFCNTYESILTDPVSPLLAPLSARTNVHPALPDYTLCCLAGPRKRGVHYLAQSCETMFALATAAKAPTTVLYTGLTVTSKGSTGAVSCMGASCQSGGVTVNQETTATGDWVNALSGTSQWMLNISQTGMTSVDDDINVITSLTTEAMYPFNSTVMSLTNLLRDPADFKNQHCSQTMHSFTGTSTARPTEQFAPLLDKPTLADTMGSGSMRTSFDSSRGGGYVWKDLRNEDLDITVTITGVGVVKL
ncbi:hypothetical protein J8273_4036 [Carpediemonas membranifera]|uniref:Uncharacterized protein n=1 Tax=Carpediemonas membranifera TaxID=201153 RepID=A0A8J6BC96_9EUKA|nr:hypothetical protein J8273_4036 [Carpediemonas membranifera]|eukprot:KAG9394392.1 hypothetical protein J8273_4036 [Carpediemonas membranifera]